jgi:hypothetical protein
MDKTEVDTYRNKVFILYAAVGFLIAVLVLANVQDSMLSEVSSTMAATFTLIIAGFTGTGGAVANAIYSLDDACDPWTHRRAIIKSLPMGVAASAVMLAVVMLAMLTPLLELCILPGLALVPGSVGE